MDNLIEEKHKKTAMRKFGYTKLENGKKTCPFCFENCDDDYCVKCKKCFTNCNSPHCTISKENHSIHIPCIMCSWGEEDKLNKVGFGHDFQFESLPKTRIFFCPMCRKFTPTVSANMFESPEIARTFLYYMKIPPPQPPSTNTNQNNQNN